MKVTVECIAHVLGYREQAEESQPHTVHPSQCTTLGSAVRRPGLGPVKLAIELKDDVTISESVKGRGGPAGAFTHIYIYIYGWDGKAGTHMRVIGE